MFTPFNSGGLMYMQLFSILLHWFQIWNTNILYTFYYSDCRNQRDGVDSILHSTTIFVDINEIPKTYNSNVKQTSSVNYQLLKHILASHLSCLYFQNVQLFKNMSTAGLASSQSNLYCLNCSFRGELNVVVPSTSLTHFHCWLLL